MKKLAIFLVTLITITGILGSSALAEEVDVPIYVDGKKIEFDVMPQIIEGRTRVPMRKIFEALGAMVTWDDESKTATAKRGNITVKITAMENALYKNDENIELDVPAEIIDGRTVVPLRAVSEAFDTEVLFYADIKTIYIESDPSKTELTVLYNLNRDPDLVPAVLKDAFLGAGWLENVESEMHKKWITKIKEDMFVYTEYPNVLSIDNIFPALYCSKAGEIYTHGLQNPPDYEYRFEAKSKYLGEQYTEFYATFLESEGYTLICKMLSSAETSSPTMIYELVTPDKKNLVEIYVERAQSEDDCAHVAVNISDYTGESKCAYEEGYFNPQYRTALYALDGRTVIVPKEDTKRYLVEGWYAEPMVQLYSLDETIIVRKVYTEDYIKDGWYLEPVRVLYATGGRSHIFTETQVPAQLEVGWYTEPVVGMYNQADEEIVVYPHEVDAYRAKGWFAEYDPVTIMYAADGRSIYVRDDEVDAYRAVGWHDNVEEIARLLYCVTGPEYILSSDVNEALASGYREYSYPIIFTENAAFSTDKYGEINFYWSPQNISGKTIIAYDIAVYFLGPDGEFLTDKYGRPISKTYCFDGPVYPDETLNIKKGAGYVNRCEQVVIGDIFLRFYDMTTDAYWLGQIIEREAFD